MELSSDSLTSWYHVQNKDLAFHYLCYQMYQMPILVYSLSSLAISQLLFMGLLNLRFFGNQVIGKLFAFLSICLIAVIVVMLPTLNGDSLAWTFAVRLAFASPAVLWCIAYFIFEDSQKIPPRLLPILFGYQVALPAARSGYFDGEISIFLSLSAYIIMVGFAAHVVILALRGRNIDLVEHRRRFRIPFAVGQSLLLVPIIGIAFVLSWTDIPKSEPPFSSLIILYYAIIFVFTLAINLASFEIYEHLPTLSNSPDESFTNSSQGNPSEDCINPRILRKINSLMDSEELYRDPRLTIKVLASNVFISEHKMRKVINREMGFKNFNQYLNHYRIAKAKTILSTDYQLPVYSIALDVGFASLSSFSKAFKEKTGLTPSEYRKKGDLHQNETAEAYGQYSTKLE